MQVGVLMCQVQKSLQFCSVGRRLEQALRSRWLRTAVASTAHHPAV